MNIITRLWTALVLGILFVLLQGSAAYAVDEGGTPPGGLVTIPDLWLTFLVATLIPILVGLVKARYSSTKVGSYLLLGLSVISGFLTSLYATGGVFELKTAAVSVVISFVTAYGAHKGFLSNVGVTGDDGVVLRKVSGGIGKTDDTVDDHPVGDLV